MKIVPQSVELVDYMGNDLSVVNAARVSFAKESESFSEKDEKLIRYLAEHNHWSPFAHTSLQFRIKAPIFVARQLVKHQVGGVWNEVSRRYVDDEPEFYFPSQWRGKPVNSKQGSSEQVIDLHNYTADGRVDDGTWRFVGLPYFDGEVERIQHLCLAVYQRMIEIGVAPEQARMVLPQNTMTEWVWTGSLYFFARVCNLRLDSHAQAETREIAEKISSLIPKEFEYSWRALIGKKEI